MRATAAPAPKYSLVSSAAESPRCSCAAASSPTEPRVLFSLRPSARRVIRALAREPVPLCAAGQAVASPHFGGPRPRQRSPRLPTRSPRRTRPRARGRARGRAGARVGKGPARRVRKRRHLAHARTAAERRGRPRSAAPSGCPPSGPPHRPPRGEAPAAKCSPVARGPRRGGVARPASALRRGRRR